MHRVGNNQNRQITMSDAIVLHELSQQIAKSYFSAHLIGSPAIFLFQFFFNFLSLSSSVYAFSVCYVYMDVLLNITGFANFWACVRPTQTNKQIDGWTDGTGRGNFLIEVYNLHTKLSCEILCNKYLYSTGICLCFSFSSHVSRIAYNCAKPQQTKTKSSLPSQCCFSVLVKDTNIPFVHKHIIWYM